MHWTFGFRLVPKVFRASPLLASLILLVTPASAVFAEMLSVPADSNIFGAGHLTPPAPGGGGAGALPPEYDFGFVATPKLFITFSSITGTVIVNTGSGDNINDPDGVGAGSANSSVNSLDGLSGISGPNAGFLVGVFEADLEPVNPAPVTLNFSSFGTNFLVLSPALNQVFFIGDGRTGDGTGTTQEFEIPEGATRIFLGIADAPGYHGDPGGYSDNTGIFTTSFSINPIPEPSVLSLIAAGASMAVFWVRRRLSKT